MSTPSKPRGIDLGTTNSEIAELRGTSIHVFRNSAGAEYTPSAVYLNKSGNLVIGREAKERYESFPEDAFIEFKRDMGSNADYTFARDGRRMKPEDLSAEILKSLCGDVQRVTGEIVTAAVITVPADFNSPQNEATKRAAALAGIKHAALLIEPVAAALAYGFDSADDKTFWLVYDFGGGTFDAAIIQVHDGMLQVVGHAGDNHLGGKNIDWTIVENQLIPALIAERITKVFPKPEDVFADTAWSALLGANSDLEARFRGTNWRLDLIADCYHNEAVWSQLSKACGLTGIRRGNPKWRQATAKLKIQAEEAKIRLSSCDSTEIRIDFLCNDDHAKPVEFEFQLTRVELDRLATPFVRKTINICKEALDEQHLAADNISRLILVGGPTMMPLLRQMLQAQDDGVGIPLEFSVDPLTVVARGAAVFAASQRLGEDGESEVEIKLGQYGVKLDYERVNSEIDPPVAGSVSAGEGVEMDFTGFTIEFVNPDIRPAWRSGKIGLGPKGNFLTNVTVEQGSENTLQIELCDATGTLQEVNPKTLSILAKGPRIPPPQLTHSMGVALSNNLVRGFFKKGTSLPARKVDSGLHTTVALKKGQSGQLLCIPVVEGEKSRADRNRLVGTLTIPADSEKVTRDVPVGSEIQVTLEIDKERNIQATAYIPILNDDFEVIIPIVSHAPSAKELIDLLQGAKDRLGKVRIKADATDDATAQAALQRIDGECMVSEAEKLVGPAATEGDPARQCLNVLNRLNSSLDDVEEALEWPALVAEAEEELERTRKVVDGSKHTTSDDRQEFASLEQETREAIEHHVPDLLRRRKEALASLAADIALRDPGPWVGVFEELKEKKEDMTDPAAAESLFAQGNRAIENNNLPALKGAVRSLLQLLPRAIEEFIEIKRGGGIWTNPARASQLFAEGESAVAAKNLTKLKTIIEELKTLRPGVGQ